MTSGPGRLFQLTAAKQQVLDALLAEEGVETNVPRLRPRPASGTSELSFSQWRLWFLDRLEPESPVYNLFAAVRLAGVLDPGALELGLGEMERRHEVLRSVFPSVEGKPVQVVSAPRPAHLPSVDLQGLADAAARAEQLAAEVARQPFDLANGPVWRALLLRRARARHVLLLSFHHIVADGASMEVLLRELAALYEAFRAGLGSPLAPLTFQYADFAHWQRRWLRGEVLERQLAYWRQQLDGAPAALELPTDRPRPRRRRGRGRRLTLALPRDLTERLRALSRERGATLFMTLLSALQVLLHRISGATDLLVGSPTANRRRPELEGIVGCFVNTLVLRTDLTALERAREVRFQELLSWVREMTLEAYSHQDLPFEKLVEELRPVRDPSRPPLVQVLFAFQEASRSKLRLPGLTLGFQELDSRTAKFDLLLSIEAGDSGLRGSLSLDADLFTASTSARVSSYFCNLLVGIAAAPQERLSRLSLLSAAEQHQLRVEWNDTESTILGEGLYRSFERQAERVAERVALVFGEQQLTYCELERRAHGLAHELERQGMGPEARVGLCLERSVEMVSALFGILKSGAAYVPLEPSYPAARLRFMVDDARVSLVVTRTGLRDVLPAGVAQILVDRRPHPSRGNLRTPLAAKATARNLAYVIFTSGSSGRPKATAISRASVANLADALEKTVYRRSTSPLRVGLNAPLVFDAAVKQLIQLLTGHTLVIVPETARRDGSELFQHLVETRLNALDTTPAQLRLLLAAGLGTAQQGAGADTALERVLVGGEALDEATWRRLARLRSIDFWNVYGPTECTVDATVCPVTIDSSPSLGRPLGQVRLAVVNPHLAAVGIGVPGHLHIAGAGLARGYLGRPGATAVSFVPDPDARRPGRRRYRTGDRACHESAGGLRFLGRLDRQIKIAGYRIEPGEIEAALRRYPAVRDARVVVRRQGGEDQLTAYVMSGEPTPWTPGELRRQLARELPARMIPGAWVALEAFPLTPNGKIDLRALPAPGRERPALMSTYTAPRGPIEEMLVEIWGEVLERRPVGVRDNFFALGGHSLLATQVVSRIRKTFGAELALRHLFESPTIAELAPLVRAAAGWAGLARRPIRPRDRRIGPVLSYAQERLWFLDQLNPRSALYNVPGAWRLEGALDPAALAKCLDEIVRRHEVLRARFVAVDGRPAQVIAPRLRLRWPVWDLAAIDEQCRERETARLVEREIRRPFRLSRGPLLRAALVRLGPRSHVAVFTMHHIVSDAWSRAVLTREIATLYAVLREENRRQGRSFPPRSLAGGDSNAGRPPPVLAPLSVQYADFAAWQRELLRGKTREIQLAYWRRQLDQASPHLEMPTDRPRPARRRPEGATLGFHWPAALLMRLESLARQRGVSLFMILLASLQSLLGRYTGQQDLSVGSVVANRHHLEIEDLIGFFVNTLVLRGDLSGNPTFGEFLERVRKTALGAYAHQDLPFELLVEEHERERDASRTPLFQVMLVLQNAPRSRLEIPGLVVRPFEVATATTKFDLTLILNEDEAGLSGIAELSTALFDTTTVGRLVRHFKTLTRNAACEPRQRLSELSWWTAAERAQLRVEWSTGRFGTPSEHGLEVLFDSQASSTPDAVAVVCGGSEEGDGPEEHWSYRWLLRRARRLAHYLRTRGVGPEVRVAFYLERGPRAVVAILATVSAGGAYVPLDPGDPAERLAFLLRDARAAVLLTESRFRPGLPASDAEVIELDRIPVDGRADDRALAAPTGNAAVGCERLAYVMYTSGSTGSPKGVGVSHRAVTQRVREVDYVTLGPRQTFLLLAPLAFDASTFEIWAPLSSGGRLVIFPPRAPSLEALGRSLSMYRITTLWLTAGLFHQVVEPSAAVALGGLDQLLAGGDVLSERHVRRAREMLRGGRLLNAYGPTEATTFACCYPVAAQPRTEAPIPIGRPIDNTRAYLLDRHLRPVPAGVSGQLFLGGDGLARGYLGRPALSARRFLPDPFLDGGERLYESGDRARFRADGNLEFLGRLDYQVKVRGFRVEPGEVEAAFGLHPAVREVAVAVRSGSVPGDRRLTAYLVVEGEPAVAELRRFLKGKLAGYMTPSFFIFLDALPLNSRGKVDRSALEQAAARRASVARSPGRPPRTPAEELTAEIWSDVLDCPEPSLDDDFFELGGHSLLATQVVSRLREAFGVEVAVQQIFETPTLAGLATAVDRAVGLGRAPLSLPLRRARHSTDGTELSFAQKRLWFLDRLADAARTSQGAGGGEALAYLISAVLHLEGTLDPTSLLRSLAGIVRRHETLRTRFVERDGKPLQVVAERLVLVIPRVDLRRLTADRVDGEARRLASREARRPFDLGVAPLLRLTLLRLAHRRHFALLTLHHIVSDAWSMDILVRELRAYYEALLAGRRAVLPELPIQYADFARWQGEWLRGEVLESQLVYWKTQLGARPEVLQLPADRPRPARRSYRGAVRSDFLPEDLSAALRELGRRWGATLFMTLLAVFEVLLARVSGQDGFVVGVPVANRRWRWVEGLIGFFVNTLALRADLCGDPRFGELLRRVRTVALGAYAHQDLPFERLVEALQPERDFSRSPLFQVLFALQNAPRPAFELPGLTLTPLEVDSGTAKYDLSLYVDEAGPGLRASFEHNADLFDRTTIRRLAEQFQTLLRAAAENPDRRCSELPLQSAAQRHHLLHEWNDTEVLHRPELLLHQLIESQMRRTPEAIALAGHGHGGAPEWLSYRQLDRRADRWARRLRALGVAPEVRVGISTSRSPEMVAGMLGVLKAGGAYIPLDPDQPPPRLEFLKRDGGVSVMLTDRESTAERGIRALPMPDAARPAPKHSPSRRGAATVADALAMADNLAYVMYTSGSTGAPKGVAVTHRNVTALLRWAERFFPPRELTGVLASTSIGFDLSVFEIFLPLTRGGRVLLAANALDLIRTEVLRDAVSLLNTVPAVMAELIRAGAVPGGLCAVNLAGEPLSWELVEAIRQQTPARRLLNLYGPTEDTVYSTCAVLPAAEPGPAPPPIGRPVAATQVFLLDRFLWPVPLGARGEICLGGAALARGYLDRSARTARSFVPHSMTSKPGGRLYKTGDLARYRADGALEFLGRRDHQIKLRGFRIEPGEVEARLRSHPAVRECLVLARPVAGDPRLVAYVATSADAGEAAEMGTPDTGDLRSFLEARLPRYMVPAVFEFLETLPRTPSGKVDRGALPDLAQPHPEGNHAGAGRPFVAPRTKAEQDLAEIWRELLGVERVGVHDDFFDRGGHSLLAVQLVSRIRATHRVELSLPIIFERSTLGELAAEVTRRQEREDLPMSAAIAEDEGEWLLAHLDELSDEEVADLLEKISVDHEKTET